MKNFMKYICLFLAIVGINASVLGKEHFEFSSFTLSGTPKTVVLSGTDVDVHINKASGVDPTWHSLYGEAMLYSGNTLVITPKNGKTITRIAYTYQEYEGSGQAIPTIASVVGEEPELSFWNSTTNNWSGIAETSVTLTLTGSAGHLGFSSLEISYEGDNDPGDPYGNANNSAMDHISLRTPAAPIIITTTEANGHIDFRLDGADLYQYGGYTLTLQDEGIGDHAIWSFSKESSYSIYKTYDAQKDFVVDVTLYYEFLEAGTDNMSFTALAYGTDGSTEYVLTIPVQVTYVADGPFSVTYDANEATSGSVPTDENEYHHGDNATVLGNTGNLARTGYKWIGWNTQANAHGTHYDADASLPIDYDNVTLYAEWVIASSITLDANGHGTNGSAIGIKGEPIESFVGVTPDDGFTVDGYWTTADNSGVCVLSSGGLTMMQESVYTTAEGNWNVRTEHVTLFAHYAVRYTGYQAFCPRTIEFDKNGMEEAIISNWPDEITNLKRGYVVPESKSAAVRSTNPSVAVATFLGWYKESEGENEWNWETDVVGTGDVTTLYAKWEVAKVNVTYHHAGENHVESVSYNAHPAGFTPDACAAADRVFVGWSEREVAMQDAEPTMVDPKTFSITAEKHFYAVYASKNGGKVTGSERSKGYNTIQANHSTTIANFEYGEASYSGAAGTENWLSLDFKGKDNHLTTKNKINDLSAIEVTWRANGANANNVEIRISEDAEVWTTIQTVSSVGTGSSANQKFDLPVVGDYYVEIFVPARDNGTDKLLFSNVTFYSKARTFYLTDYATSCEKAASMTLTYDAAGGSEQTAVTEAGWVTLPDGDACVRGCYTLTGWLCSGDDKTYVPGAKYLFNHDVTMTAQWAVDAEAPVTVTYHTGLEGATTETVADVHCGDKLDEKLPVPAPCDAYKFTFEGWTTNGSYAESTTAPEMIDLGTYVVNGDVALYAVWSHGKNIFTKQTAESPFDVGDQIIIVEPTHQQALSASLACAEAPETSTNIIETDERYIVWTLSDAGDGKFNLKGINGNLHIAGNTTRALELLDDANYASATYKGFTITKSSSYYALTQSVDVDKTRRVNYNKKKGIWNTYATNTAGYIYKKTGATSKTYTLDGVCERVYHATEAPVLITSTGQSLSAEGIVVVENPDANTPVAVLTDGSDHFTVTVSSEGVTTNGDGSKNYKYKVTYTPTAADQTETATFSFQHSAEGGEAHTTPDAVTFTGHSLPAEFVIAAKVDDKYYMLPGNSAMSTPDAIELDVVDGKAMNVAAEHIYSAQTVTKSDYKDIALSLNTTTGLLWQSKGSGTETNIANNGSAGGTRYGLDFFSWTFGSEDYVTYTINNQTDDERNLAMNTSSKKFGYYNVNASYTDALYILPIAVETGEKMDIVDWTSSSVTLNMNGSTQTVTIGSETKTKSQREADRTMVIPVSDLTTDGFIQITGANGSTSATESQRYYKVPHIYESDATVRAAEVTPNSILWVRSGVLTVSDDVRVAAVYVCPGAEVKIVGSLTCDKLVLRTTAWQAAAISGNFTAGQTFYSRIVTNQKYQQFGLPLASSIDAVRLSNGKTTPYGSTWLLNSYDGARRAASGADGSNWTNLADHSMIAANTGYEMWSNTNYYREFYFPVNPGAMATTVHATAHTGSAGVQHQGWNALVAPKMSRWSIPAQGAPSEQMKISELVDYDIYWQHIATNMQPALPFYIQVAENVDLSFSVAPSVAARQAVKDEVQEQWLQLNYENAAGVQDEANLFVHPTKFSPEYEVGYDVAKMSTSGSRPFIYSQLACGNLAFAAVPDSLAETMIPLAVYTPEAGEMTFSLTENEYQSRLENVYLVDQNVIVADLLNNSYTYEAEAGTTAGRFYLMCVFRHAPETPTDINSASGASDIAAKKVFYRDHIYIVLPNGHVWDATGKTVK